MRGQPFARGALFGHERIIPARAGPTDEGKWEYKDSSDHPRSCGANASQPMVLAKACGSSPLVRGQPAADGQPQHSRRIIPARAGPTA